MEHRDPSTIIPTHPRLRAHALLESTASTRTHCSRAVWTALCLSDGRGRSSSRAQGRHLSRCGPRSSRGPWWWWALAPFQLIKSDEVTSSDEITANPSYTMRLAARRTASRRRQRMRRRHSKKTKTASRFLISAKDLAYGSRSVIARCSVRAQAGQFSVSSATTRVRPRSVSRTCSITKDPWCSRWWQLSHTRARLTRAWTFRPLCNLPYGSASCCSSM